MKTLAKTVIAVAALITALSNTLAALPNPVMRAK